MFPKINHSQERALTMPANGTFNHSLTQDRKLDCYDNPLTDLSVSVTTHCLQTTSMCSHSSKTAWREVEYLYFSPARASIDKTFHRPSPGPPSTHSPVAAQVSVTRRPLHLFPKQHSSTQCRARRSIFIEYYIS